MGNREANASDGSGAILGNNNHLEITNNIIKPLSHPKRNFIFDICKLIAEADFSNVLEYSISNISGWQHKIEFNKIIKYKSIFEEYSFAREDIEELLNGFEKRTMLVRHIKTMYIHTLHDNPESSNDNRLDIVFQQMCRIVDDVNTSAEGLYLEERDEAIYQLMFYAFTKCQLLMVPSEEGV
ncbi:hypothetical protein [Listeria newyorkensis]|uniref:Uncharacterized protein n=1 Tax=Listeria newyorkensis TaxID=1497681 RepID=A0A841YY84_9LIST|nr:hypothetical protein [Listeria newyorkensis]MBC1458504.1 hypothetical protein [Listeria newyorkensis]